MSDCEVSSIMTEIADKTVQSATYHAINEHKKTVNVVSGHTVIISVIIRSCPTYIIPAFRLLQFLLP